MRNIGFYKLFACFYERLGYYWSLYFDLRTNIWTGERGWVETIYRVESLGKYKTLPTGWKIKITFKQIG